MSLMRDKAGFRRAPHEGPLIGAAFRDPARKFGAQSGQFLCADSVLQNNHTVAPEDVLLLLRKKTPCRGFSCNLVYTR